MPDTPYPAAAAVVHSLRWSSDPEPMAVTYGVSTIVGATVGDLQDVADEAAQAFTTHVKPLLPATISLVQTEVAWAPDAGTTEPLIGVSTIGAGACTGPGTSLLPANNAHLVHKRSNLGGRRGRGRMYFPGVDETGVDNLGQILSTTVTSWNTALAAWLAAIAGSTTLEAMVLLHASSTAANPSPRPTSPAIVTQLTLDPVISTQRRRLRK